MAKGYAMERWQGKKGSNVFYKISNSSNAQKQGVRERVYEVSNPKTRSQALQRMKVRAAQNFYNTLAPILNRAMQGVKYGGMTRNEFMKYALSMSSSPAVEKGSSVAIPGAYLLSKGSLPGFAFNGTTGNGIEFSAPWVGNFEIVSDATLTRNNINDICANGAVREGDQITFIVVNVAGNYQYMSFTLSEGETIPMFNDKVIIIIDGIFAIGNFSVEDWQAAAVILSRKSGNKYERSTAYLALNEDSVFIKEAYSTQAINAALATYQKSVSVNGETDWPVEPEDEEQGGGSFTISAPYVLSGMTGAKASLNGRKVLVYENVNTGDLTAVGTLSGYLVDFATRETLLYMQDAVFRGLVPADVTALASLPHNEISNANAGI